jgi:DNA (cytosine-5)-methyltransferase 1
MGVFGTATVAVIPRRRKPPALSGSRSSEKTNAETGRRGASWSSPDGESSPSGSACSKKAKSTLHQASLRGSREPSNLGLTRSIFPVGSRVGRIAAHMRQLKSPRNEKRRPFARARLSAIDLFCGAGGLAHGLKLAGIKVAAGIDADPACRTAIEKNNGAVFVCSDVKKITGAELETYWGKATIRVLVGCAPCQPFSKYNQAGGPNGKWFLLNQFARLVRETSPDVISMENVKELLTFKRSRVYRRFTHELERLGYFISEYTVYCPDYGVPQTRTRLVMFASKFGRVELVAPTHTPANYRTVRQTIGHLPPVAAGEIHPGDPLHRACALSDLNLRRVKASKPGGTWRDWPADLRLTCHRKVSGDGYVSVYGRMHWDEPSPTMTTQCVGLGNGRFGHPVQDRAITLREAALLQSFPPRYRFVDAGEPVRMGEISRLIGNAVPVALGKAIGRSIVAHCNRLQRRRQAPHRSSTSVQPR